MRKWASFFLSILLGCLLCACNHAKEEIHLPVNFYYCNQNVTYQSADSVIRAEVREGEHFSADMEKMLHSYLQGPINTDLLSPVPVGTTLIHMELEEEMLSLTFSEPFSTLNGIRLSIAGSCIVKTVSEFSHITSVQFWVDDGQGNTTLLLTMRENDVVLVDNAEQKG